MLRNNTNSPPNLNIRSAADPTISAAHYRGPPPVFAYIYLAHVISIVANDVKSLTNTFSARKDV